MPRVFYERSFPEAISESKGNSVNEMHPRCRHPFDDGFLPTVQEMTRPGRVVE